MASTRQCIINYPKGAWSGLCDAHFKLCPLKYLRMGEDTHFNILLNLNTACTRQYIINTVCSRDPLFLNFWTPSYVVNG